MPFTLSHAVLAPPLSKLSKGHLPLAALAIGCMTPDLYRLFTQENINLTHQWAGLLFPNLPIGLFFCLLWYLIYRPVIYRILGIQHPLNLHSFDHALSFLFMNCLGISIGIATHLIWDGLTHLDFRTFAFKEILAQNISLLGFHYPLHFVLQIGSSIIALPFLMKMCWHYYKTHQHHHPVPSRLKGFALISMILSIFYGLFSVFDYNRHISADLWNSERYFFIGKSINEFTQAGLTVFTMACLLFLFWDRTERLKSF
ncbi:hypothetical protein F993_00468 [Acinetobacter proteolyticus]|uniref:Phospholipase n=1 Tax=Acinetobacter proteolyticus TaxID=1776741 RepID=A0ABN0JIJ7_9GAMM|nr:DUF4184 family protein [Acinetobacter proteolyticus]ENU25078.1 hypothetical protein F993_00468 [Acinetobacter proteolyticus]OEY94276.1 phospholipase [Acinetobacter proteolyticus]QHH94171.1 DUF4184 family protein [Acinetobacter gyllenbergii]